MEPRIVEQAPMPPGQCLFSQDIDGPFIDTGVKAPWVSPYGYISVKYVEFLARELLNMIPGHEVTSQIEDLKHQLDAYADEVEELRRIVDAHETLEQFQEGAI